MKKIVMIILLTVFILSFSVAGSEDELHLPYIGRFTGHWDLSAGVHFWPPDNHLKFRNLQLRANMDLAPGLRTNMVLRSNREFDTLRGFDPTFDELYLEGYGFYRDEAGELSASLRVGNMRYLRFPYPDLISTFDQVPGTEDLREGTRTGYQGQMLSLEYETDHGVGYHLTGINWGFDGSYGNHEGIGTIQNYLFYRNQFGPVDFETRFGEMQLRHPGGPIEREGRPYQLGRSGSGYSIYLGGNWEGYRAGFLYEDLKDEKFDERDIRTGVMVSFDFSFITEKLGETRFDYTRSPQGLGMHYTLADGYLGNIKTEPPEGAVPVGGEKAERMITYWQNGQGRNFYEHRSSRWGQEYDEDLIVVIEEKPWYLQLEALVSPHTSFSSREDLKTWERHRQGPAQLCQEVTYRFYRKE